MPRLSFYYITLRTGGETHAGKGGTIAETLEKINLSWEKIKFKGIMNIRKGQKKHEHLFNVIQLRRIFGNKLVRAKWSQNLEYLMK